MAETLGDRLRQANDEKNLRSRNHGAPAARVMIGTGRGAPEMANDRRRPVARPATNIVEAEPVMISMLHLSDSGGSLAEWAVGIWVYWVAYFVVVGLALLIVAAHGFTPEWLEAVATAVAAGFAGFAAIKGLQLWRDENLGHRRAELAEEILLAATHAAETINTARTPSLRALGTPSDPTLSGYEQRLAYVQRTDGVFSQLAVAGMKGRLFISPDLDQPIRMLGTIRAEMLIDLQTLIRDQQAALGPEAEPLLHAARLKVFATQDDDVSRRCDEAMRQVEAITMPHIRLVGTST
jgi:hypothetical protein